MADSGDIPSNITLAAGKVLRRNAANDGFEAFTPGAGGSNGSIFAPDDPPASPNSHDDEFDAETLDEKWSWVNQNSTTIDLTTWPGTLLWSVPASNGDNIPLLVQTKPAGAFTMTARVAIARKGDDFSAVGIGMRDSGSGRIITLYWDYNIETFSISGTGIQVESFHSPTEYRANIAHTEWSGNYVYLRWQDNATNFIWSFSPDGKCYCTVGSQSRTDWLANPNQIFLSAAINNNSFNIQACHEWFRVTEP